MSSNRIIFNNLGQKPAYLLFSLIFILLSLIAFIIFQKINKSSPFPSQPNPFYPPLSASPTSPPANPTLTLPLQASAPAQPANFTPSPTPTPAYQTFTSSVDHFSVNFSLSRRLYQDQPGIFHRYTFYNPQGSFAIHVGPDWSWQHPGRQFSSEFTLSGQPTFRYDINLQTIVDIDQGERKYTLQCIHNASPQLKTECDQFLSSFKLL